VKTRNACKIVPENRRMECTQKAKSNFDVFNNIKMDFTLLKLEILLNRRQKLAAFK
jgi:hypothetical protein